jgi:DnaJ-class molecular chaperone
MPLICRLAMQGHPKEVAMAYEVLSDEEKRREYDQKGDEGPIPGYANAGGGGQAFAMHSPLTRHQPQANAYIGRKGFTSTNGNG